MRIRFLLAAALAFAAFEACNSHPNIHLVHAPSAPTMVVATAGTGTVTLTWAPNPSDEAIDS